LTRGDAVQRAGRAADAHVDNGRRLADDLELRRQVGELERDAQRAFDRLLAGDRNPQQRGERDRDELQSEMMTEADVRHQASELRGSATRRVLRRRYPSSVARRERSWSASKARAGAPAIASESGRVSF